MPPRKRTKRAVDALSISRAERGINTSGFAVLPAELHAEILSHLPQYPVRCDPIERSAIDKEGLDRQFTLHSLSRTCSALRAACLPFLWEGIEVYEGFKIPRKGTRLGKIPLVMFNVADNTKIPNARGCRNYAEELLRQLEVVTVRNPALARYVKFLNVTLTQISLSAVREELIRCLSLFPNMTTVRMVIWEGTNPRYFTPLEGITFPQVRTLYLNGGSDWFSSLCPNARSIAFSSEYELSVCQDSFYWLSAARPIGAQIEVLGLFPFQHRSNICMNISTNFPNIQDITLECYLLRNTIAARFEEYRKDPLVNLKRLQIVRLRMDLHIGHGRPRYYDLRPKVPSFEEQQQWCEWAKNTLLKVQARDKLEKRVYFTSHVGESKIFVMKFGMPIEVEKVVL